MTTTSETVLVRSSTSQPDISKPSLVNLPTEILVMILEHCLVRSKAIRLLIRQEGEGLLGMKSWKCGLVPEVLCVCKRMFAQGISILYGCNIFRLGPLSMSLQRALQKRVNFGSVPPPPPQPLETNFWRISKIQIPIGQVYAADSDREGLHSQWQVCDPALRRFRVKSALLQWPQTNNLQWINCKVDDFDGIWTAGDHVGMPTINQKSQLRTTFQHGHPDESTLNEYERSCGDYVFRLSALKVARTFQECAAGFTRFYRAIRPTKHQCIQRSVVVTKGPIESVPGCNLDNMKGLRYVSSVAESRAGTC